jgi:HD-GYP domain-containing protein (c-di-GMP phosphodiesterase class II)
VNPTDADALQAMREQLKLFARDLQFLTKKERERRMETEAAYRELNGAYISMIRTLAVVCEMKDNYTRNHLDRTYQFAMALTKRVAPELSDDPAIGYGYLLHDIGKVGVPDQILNKPGPLDDDEWKLMRMHPINGWQLVQGIKFLGDATKIIRWHHERWDGRGYPEGIAGEDIYLPARIFSIIDTFDAMTTDRPYRAAMPVDHALEEIERMGGTQFDPDLASEFVKMCVERGVTDPDALHFVR